MAESGLKPGRDFGFIMLFVVLLGVLWYAQGGHNNPPPGPFWEGPTFSNYSNTSVSSPDSYSYVDTGSLGNSEVKNIVNFDLFGIKETNPQKEYLEISNDSFSGLLEITDWSVKGKNNFEVKIPKAVRTYVSNKINLEENIVLKPGDKAVVVTGKSPLGASFRLNKCMGYIAQNQEFYPRINLDCPYPSEENWPAYLSDQCLDYIDSLPRCRANLAHPLYIENNCIEETNKTLTYNKCVELHQNDRDFYKKEWRIYLGRNEELWRNSYETIFIADKNGETIKTIPYK